ncbi:MAG: hypothetical protein H7070_02100 [Saprospiraceae bacterium]|nr:hypothetical protein [Pyrinomonadaceae bacterium]
MPPTRTRRQREVLDFIRHYIEGHGYEPSYQLIARHFGVRSKAGIAKHVEALEEQGFLTRRRENGSFKLELSRASQAADAEFAVEWLGPPADDEDPDEWELVPLAVPKFMLGEIESSEIYAYRMPDDAMSGKHICSGDVVLIANNSNVRDGACVAVLMSKTETILRNYYRDGASIELRAANDNFPPIRLFADEIKILGVFRGLLRPVL